MTVGRLNDRTLFRIYHIGLPKDSKGFKILAGGKLSCHALDFKKICGYDRS